MRALFIVNPSAGHGRAGTAWESHRKIIFDHLGEHSYEITKRPGHATEIASKLSEGEFDVVVSCGGDGTLNEVVNGVVGKNIKVAVLPLGTGSDFGKSIGIRTLEDFIAAMKAGNISAVDVFEINFSDMKRRYYLNILEIGFGAEVMDYVNSHKYFGRRSFSVGVFSTIWKMHPFDLSISIDGEDKTISTIEAILANGKYFGGGMMASPTSAINDGLLDIHILMPFSKVKTALNLRYLVDGSYIDRGYANSFRGRSVSVKSHGHLVEADGEVIGRTPINVSVAGQISFIAK